ncbi:GAF domain-containing protein [Rhodothermus marinus]|uniref:GAF domain-containing protein n=1 Tax=Rhodothermus marinus TaxID=29549 RepID=UPI000A720B6B|nr:GAF domain-containing protein [Rhodothermus marinus]
MEAARLLVAPDPLDMEALLRILGEATDAASVYFVGVPQSGEAQDYSYTVWHRQQPKTPHWWQELEARLRKYFPTPATQDEVHQLGENLLVVPVLSAEDEFYGYLGLEFADGLSEVRQEEARLLEVLGGLLATYFDRRATEAARRESEERCGDWWSNSLSRFYWCPVTCWFISTRPDSGCWGPRPRKT